MLICTDVSWTYVAWTNGWLASVKDGKRNLPLKSGQNQVSNSGDIANMEKCHQGMSHGQMLLSQVYFIVKSEWVHVL